VEPISIFIALCVILAAILVPGLILSSVIVKNVTVSERFGLGIAFGTVPIFIVYLLVKNNIMLLNLNTVLLAICICSFSWLLTKDGRKRGYRWLFVSGNK